MRIPLESRQIELEIKKSRFIAVALPCASAAEVKEQVKTMRKLHPQATHVVHAAVLGPAGTEYAYSDDHEPKNTAGRPALEVLKGSGITNILVLIIRYFGGTLLGTGGLVKAYGDSVKAVIDGIKTEQLIEKSKFFLEMGYDFYETAKKALAEAHAVIEQEDFTTSIMIAGTIPTAEEALLSTVISDLSLGKVSIHFTAL